MLGSNQRRLSRRFYRPPALFDHMPPDLRNMRLAAIFTSGPVRHMSVRVRGQTGETTDNHGQRPQATFRATSSIVCDAALWLASAAASVDSAWSSDMDEVPAPTVLSSVEPFI